ncbi:MAG: dTDP-4-dehydrorhamnose reductase, partial [Chitinophagaceae bacterium]|nr:dTDP-4-dehydrorhamnose reductase [Chitinophagaceae bacterium]
MTGSKKILVTGSNGQLGKEIQRICSTLTGYEFIFLSKSDMPINQFELVRHIFNTLKPAYCINCAAYTAVDKAEEERDLAFEINGEAVGVLAAICSENETKFIHISTDYVFEGNGTQPYVETDETSSINTYGASKLKGEEEAFRYNPETIIIRTSWVYSEFGNNFVKTMLRLMKDKNSISVVNDQFGSPTYAADLASVIFSIIQFPEWKPGIYHFSNEGVITWFDFAT